MATPQTDPKLAQQALDTIQEFPSKTAAARALGITRGCLDSRLMAAERYGLSPVEQERPKVLEDPAMDRLETIRARLMPPIDNAADEQLAPRLYGKKDGSHIGSRHIVIPDVQTKEGVPQEHLIWIGNYIADKKPDRVICIGDFADLPSLSIYDKGKLPFEGRRYVNDIEATRRGMGLLMRPIAAEMARNKLWTPEFDLAMGNHEHRIIRTVDNNPEFAGKFELKDLGYEEFGWTVHDFLKVFTIDGVEYSHYFTSGVMGRPVSSAAALLRARQRSATMGHVQHTDIAMHAKTQQTGMFCGTCYLHDEPYLGHQGNVARRQIVVKNEVRDGVYDPMLVSLAYLKKKYS